MEKTADLLLNVRENCSVEMLFAIASAYIAGDLIAGHSALPIPHSPASTLRALRMFAMSVSFGEAVRVIAPTTLLPRPMLWP